MKRRLDGDELLINSLCCSCTVTVELTGRKIYSIARLFGKKEVFIIRQELSSVIKSAIGLCIQGDVLGAYEQLQQQPDRGVQEEEFAQELRARFLVDDPDYQVKSDDPWIRNVVTTYYRYFTAVLTKRVSLHEGESMLMEGLRNFVSAQSLEEAEEKLGQEFKERGYHFLGGKTLPYWGPYIWKSQESRSFKVSIPSGIEQLTVHFMTDFVLASWLDFATSGLASAGGWANENGLYCIAERYPSLDDVKFEISFLKHEAQHCADYRMFSNLSPKDLEYRAKLVELIYYPTKDKLGDFVRQADANVDNAHAYAAYNIVSRLSELLLNSKAELHPGNLYKISIERLQQAALQLLNENTNQLLSDGTGSKEDEFVSR